MKRKHIATSAAVALALSTVAASAQDVNGKSDVGIAPMISSPPSAQSGHVYIPDSSKPGARGFAHTNFVFRSVDGSKPAAGTLYDAAVINPDGTVHLAETPCSLGNLYVKSPATACVPSFSATGGPSAGGYGIIAVVDAYDNPNAATDLATFSDHFGLPAANFIKVRADNSGGAAGSCTSVPKNVSWAVEESLDIEWAHVFAPDAAIVLVEACSAFGDDLYYAEQVAMQYIIKNSPSGGQISNSWSGDEYSTETADDHIFTDAPYDSGKSRILVFASAGDFGLGAQYPSVSPWVISVGGTSIRRNSATDAFQSEACWSGSGGGISAYETYVTSFTGGNMGPWANYQYPIFGMANRATPDMAADADPASGVYVYSQYGAGGWTVLGGTSVSSPSLASIINRAGNEFNSVQTNAISGSGQWTALEHDAIYSTLYGSKAYKAEWYDVKTGSNGASALAGYDLCTGVGSPRGLIGK